MILLVFIILLIVFGEDHWRILSILWAFEKRKVHLVCWRSLQNDP